MSVSNETLIRLIKDRIEEQYGNPTAAAKDINRGLQLRGEKTISEDTVLRIYKRPDDSSYMPKRSSLLLVARELGIPVDTQDQTRRYLSEQVMKDINESIGGYQCEESYLLLRSCARSIGNIERYFQDYACRYIEEHSGGKVTPPQELRYVAEKQGVYRKDE